MTGSRQEKFPLIFTNRFLGCEEEKMSWEGEQFIPKVLQDNLYTVKLF